MDVSFFIHVQNALNLASIAMKGKTEKKNTKYL